jgi:uncharacterized protein Yka (UPF0111/DUF47 family)
MRVERDDDKIKLTFSKKLLNDNELNNFIDFVKFREINSQSQATQEQADELANEINQSWWKKNKHMFE